MRSRPVRRFIASSLATVIAWANWSPTVPLRGGTRNRRCPVGFNLRPVLNLIEFPADDLGRARHFWEELLGVELDNRAEGEGSGVQTHSRGVELGIHSRGAGPGDRVSLAYFSVTDLRTALEQVVELGGEVIHPGDRWAICRDSEGSPFGLVQDVL
jgi:predicted enzyme related to lactoylglutathione lyase